MKKTLPMLLLAALAGGGWYAYDHRGAFASKGAVEISEKFIARAEKRDIDSTVEVSGDVTPAFQIDVKSEVGGRVKALHVGDDPVRDWQAAAAAGLHCFRLERPANSLRDLTAWLVREKG